MGQVSLIWANHWGLLNFGFSSAIFWNQIWPRSDSRSINQPKQVQDRTHHEHTVPIFNSFKSAEMCVFLSLECGAHDCSSLLPNKHVARVYSTDLQHWVNTLLVAFKKTRTSYNWKPFWQSVINKGSASQALAETIHSSGSVRTDLKANSVNGVDTEKSYFLFEFVKRTKSVVYFNQQNL